MSARLKNPFSLRVGPLPIGRSTRALSCPVSRRAGAPLCRSRRFALLKLLLGPALALLISAHGGAAETKVQSGKPAAKVSYYREVRPILQANCQGCHQPAKTKGGYVMTEFKRLLAGGDSEGAAIVPGHPDKSAILKMITPQDGEVRMPKGKTPLLESEVVSLRTWI